MVALKNFVAPKAADAATTAKEPGVAQGLYIKGKLWSKKCAQPGCTAIHPFWLHEALTGEKLTAELQERVDRFEADKASKDQDKTKKKKVLFTTKASGADDDGDEEDYEPSTFFTGMGWSVTGNKSDHYTAMVAKARAAGGGRGHPFDSHHILFDNQAGKSMIKSADLLQDIRPLDKPIVFGGISSEDGSLVATHDGQFGRLGRIPLVPGAMANILAHGDCKRWGYRVTLVDEADEYTVDTPDGLMRFTLLPSSPRAHYACRVMVASDDANVLAVVKTVAGNLSEYDAAQVSRAIKARKLQINLGLPSTARMIQGLNGLSNRDFSADDLRRADSIGEKPLAKVRGGTHQRSPDVVQPSVQERSSPLPAWMEGDLMFVDGLVFWICVVLPLHYIMAVWLKHKTVAEVGAAITLCVDEAAAHNIDVQSIKTDGEKAVAAYAPELKRAGLNVSCEPGDKCGAAERAIEMLKEFVRAMCNGGLPYRMCKLLMVMCVLFIAHRSNVLPTKNSMDGVGAHEKWFGRPFDCRTEGRWGFGEYVEATKIKTSNSMQSRTEACILGVPTNSLHGTVSVYRISTDSCIKRSQFAQRPIPDFLIDVLNERADEDRLKGGDEWATDGGSGLNPGGSEDPDDHDAIGTDQPLPPTDAEAADTPSLIPQAVGLGSGVHMPAGSGVGDGVAADLGAAAADGLDAVAPPSASPVIGGPPALRRGRGSGGGDSLASLGTRKVFTSSNNYGQPNRRIRRLTDRINSKSEYCFKISLRAALRDREAEARVAVRAEIQQLMDRGVWHGVHVKYLTEQQRKQIIRSSIFLKDKYTAQNIFEKFKARLVAGGDQQQRELYDNVSSPTARTESVLSVAAIAAAEGREVMTVDIAGAFLHADITVTGIPVYVRLDRVMTKFLLELDSSYSKFVNADGTCVVQLDKALYGTLEAAKLWYDNLTSKFLQAGFVKNPYDECVWNKTMLNGKQVTVTFHVDDLMVTCEDAKGVEAVERLLKHYYKDITVHRGKVLDYLGMTFDFTSAGEVKVTMKKLVDEIIAGSGVVAERKTPATDALFDTRDDVEKLGQSEQDYFRSYIAKLLFVGKRARPDILAPVSFLSTRAQSPDLDDLGKLHRVLGYLLATRERGITLCIGDTMTVEAYVDAAYGVHTSSGRSHSGCCIVLGLAGPIHVKSTKQKLVTKSSTEAELVALSDYASQAIWARNFIVAQGYDVGPVVLHQDNLSCMALMKRGGPASERSRHIDIRYFWVKEKVDGKEAIVRHLATEKMFVNVMTKPLQGQQFIAERDLLTNWR
jgi:hypothetical protein